jgi:hypothetical protein
MTTHLDQATTLNLEQHLHSVDVKYLDIERVYCGMSTMSDQDGISASKPPPAMAATSVLEDGKTGSISANAQNSTGNSTENPSDKKHGNDSLDVETAVPPRGRFRTIGIVLMCCVSSLRIPFVEFEMI